VRVVVHADPETLVNLAQHPGWVDGNPIDPDLLRRMAEQGDWQLLLDSLRTAAGKAGAAPRATEPEPGPVVDHERYAPQPAADEPYDVDYTDLLADPELRDATPAEPIVGDAAVIADVLDRVDADPGGLDSDGHGGHREPPPGALTYHLARRLRDHAARRWRWCTHPGCFRPAWRCDTDHAVEYDHDDPRRGGWSVSENLHPVCKRHNTAKANRTIRAVILPEGHAVWTTATGTVAADPARPDTGGGTPPIVHVADATTPAAHRTAPDDWTEPTWWETHQPDNPTPPTRADTAAQIDPDTRARLDQLRRRYLRHTDALTQRDLNARPPF
jgi:hypothetical protein